MFKLVALLFLAANPDNPIGGMTYNQSTFATEEACSAFLESDAGKMATTPLQIAAARDRIQVKFACVADEKGESI